MIKRFKFLGWHIAVSKEPMRIKNRDKNRNRNRENVRNMRLKMAGYRCEICGKPIDIRCSLHHLLNVGEPNRNAVENVMVLCSACHHELEKRPHYHGIKHLESEARCDDFGLLLVTDEESIPSDKAQSE